MAASSSWLNRGTFGDARVRQNASPGDGGHPMLKAIKGNAGRRPPEPSPNHSDIDDWCRRLMPDLQPIVKRLDKSIRATVPGLDYAVKWKRAYYGLPELGWFIEIATYD